MANKDDENRLKKCLKACIKAIEEKTTSSTTQQRVSDEDSSSFTAANNVVGTNMHTFTLDINEEYLMKDVTAELESICDTFLPKLSKSCRKYLLDLLCENHYNDEVRKFKSPFNRGSLNSFTADLKGKLTSLEAFQAAWDGNQSVVNDYLTKYPDAKDRTGLWGTTLLYSAARNKHLNLVQFLVEKAKCSVNAQNQQHIKRALAVKITKDDDFQANPSAGSTALHAACFYGHLDIVKFLIDHGAEYFIRNHANETPIRHAQDQPKILEYFREILILGYSSNTTKLPHKPILEEHDGCVFDCIWEYKPFADQRWFPFSGAEAAQLQQSMVVKPDQPFKREIHLKVPGGIYAVSLMEFLRSGKNNDQTQRLAWLRCRGSSIANFKSYALWQVMFRKYSSAKSDPSTKMLSIPSTYDSRFKLHLDSWYFCDAQTNSRLNETMKYRRKHVKLTIDYISKKDLLFDLQDFTFNDENQTIHGFIRWIPKMISNNPRNKGKIVAIDEFQTLADMDPIPLTVSRLKQVSGKKDRTPSDNEDDNSGDMDQDGLSLDTYVFEDDDDLGGSYDQVISSDINPFAMKRF